MIDSFVMKHLLFFINNLSSGGAEHQLCELANGLSAKGYQVTITTFGDVPDHYTYATEIHRCRIAVGKSGFQKMIGIWRYFLSVKADWVIGFGQRESRLCLLPLLFRSRKIHVMAGERNTTIGKPLKQEQQLLKYLYKRADYIIPNSHAQRNHIIEVKPEYADKTITITNYTDLTTYNVSPLPEGETLYIGVLGRYNVQKNCMRFVDAVRLLKSQTNQKFVIEWFGNKKLKGEDNPLYVKMRAKVEENGLADCLILNDHIKDVPTEMQRFDAFCLPSLWEGFSNAISEAICCGKPCLVSDVADNGVMVHDGENGFLFNPRNIESIVAAFMSYFELSKDARQKMAKASRTRAEELFDYERFIGAYVSLIESI